MSRAGSVALALGILGAGSGACGPGLESTAADGTITVRVRTELASDPATTFLPIQVETLAGYVTLRGSVPSTADEAAALRVARRVEGVRGVESMLQIRPPVSLAGGPLPSRSHASA